MAKFQNKYRIESNRWQRWDYSVPGRYFLTICIANRKCILGDIKDGIMNLSSAGKIVESEIKNIPSYHPHIILDEWIVMPNHIHLLIEITDYMDNTVVMDDADDVDDTSDTSGTSVNQIHEFDLLRAQPRAQPHNQYRAQRRKMTIPLILGKLKMTTSKQINILNNTPQYKNWQRDYHDHVIRDYQAYNRIKNYIQNNPKKWEEDTFKTQKIK